MPTAQPSDTQKQLIEKILRGQRHAGSGVWHQGGVASKRTEEQTAEITNAIAISSRFNIQAIKNSAAGLIKEEDKDDERDAQKEELERKKREENEREKKQEGGFFSGLAGLFKNIGNAGKGVGGFFGGLMGFGRGFFKGIGKVFTILGWVLKWIGGPLLAIGALAFLSQDPKDQKKIIEKIVKGVEAAWEFLQSLGASFKDGFMKGWSKDDGLAKSLEEFSKAWGNVFDLIATKPIGKDGHKGLKGVAAWLGEALADFATGLVNIGTLIAKLITDPEKTVGELQGKLYGSLANLGNSIAKFFDDFFSVQNLSDIFQSITGFEFSEEIRQKIANKEQERLEERMKQVDKDIKIQKSILAQLDEAEKNGEKISTAKRIEAQMQLKFFEESKQEHEDMKAAQRERRARIIAEIEVEAELGKEGSELKAEIDELKEEIAEIDALDTGFLKKVTAPSTIGGKRMNLEETLAFIERAKQKGGGDIVVRKDKKWGFGQEDAFVNEDVEAMMEIAGLNLQQFKTLVNKISGRGAVISGGNLLEQKAAAEKRLKEINKIFKPDDYQKRIDERTLEVQDRPDFSSLMTPSNILGIPSLVSNDAGNAGAGDGAVVYNMGGNVTDQSRKSVFMFPERHLFGERLQLGRV